LRGIYIGDFGKISVKISVLGVLVLFHCEQVVSNFDTVCDEPLGVNTGKTFRYRDVPSSAIVFAVCNVLTLQLFAWLLIHFAVVLSQCEGPCVTNPVGVIIRSLLNGVDCALDRL